MKMTEFNLKENSADIGLKLGTLIFIISALLYLYDIKYITNGLLSGVSIFLTLGFGVYSIFNGRKLNQQIISFKNAFTAYFLCIVVGYLVVSVGDIIIFQFVDPEAGKILNEELMIQTKNKYETWQMPADQISMQLENMQNYPRYSYFSVFMNYIFILLINAFVGLFPAFILKKS